MSAARRIEGVHKEDKEEVPYQRVLLVDRGARPGLTSSITWRRRDLLR